MQSKTVSFSMWYLDFHPIFNGSTEIFQTYITALNGGDYGINSLENATLAYKSTLFQKKRSNALSLTLIFTKELNPIKFTDHDENNAK